MNVLAIMEADAAQPHKRLVLENIGLVRRLAYKLTTHCPTEYHDAVSDGILGLVEAAHSYDHSRDVLPSTFLSPRIYGAILDGRRKRDGLSRLSRIRLIQIRKATTKIAAKLFREPTSREVAEELGVPVETLWKWQLHAAGDEWSSLDGHAESTVGAHEMIADTLTIRDLDQIEAAASIQSALFSLNPQQLRVVGLYYADGFLLDEIGEHLGITGSRVSQILKASRKTLLSAMTRMAA